MTTPTIDLRARRAACTRDSRAVVDNIIDGAATLHAEVCGWPVRYLRTATIEGVERQLEALQFLLTELRAFTTQDGAA
ncbi:hypothetical protein [Rudaea sp.]|uniref:hypothetical protein n=1 Tax=Rudaea sp. TaxID=2136325 RepID=UPI00321FD6A7